MCYMSHEGNLSPGEESQEEVGTCTLAHVGRVGSLVVTRGSRDKLVARGPLCLSEFHFLNWGKVGV